MLEDHGKQNLNYAGSIIDIETINDYCRGYAKGDSREYKDLKVVVFGYIDKDGWHIYCAQGSRDIPKIQQITRQFIEILDNKRPLYAYNCHHEMGVFFHNLNIKILMDKELQSVEYERKEVALRHIGINESFGDPFHMTEKPGNECRLAWLNSRFDQALRHNRACLLKEQTLLLNSHIIEPRSLEFNTYVESQTRPSASFQPWTIDKENYIVLSWKNGKTLKSIAQDCGRTPNAIFMRLQKLKQVPPDILYTLEKDSCTIRELR